MILRVFSPRERDWQLGTKGLIKPANRCRLNDLNVMCRIDFFGQTQKLLWRQRESGETAEASCRTRRQHVHHMFSGPRNQAIQYVHHMMGTCVAQIANM